MTNPDDSNCRACHSHRLMPRFSAVVRRKYEAQFIECQDCGTLQVANPTWLAEDADLRTPSPSDIGAVRRSIQIERICGIMRLWRMIPRDAQVLDFGSGSGLLVRMLRDHGFQARGIEPFRTPVFAAEHHIHELSAEPRSVDLITMIEVIEHLTNPDRILEQLRPSLRARGCLLLTTELYEPSQHGRDWWYLDLDVGEHVTFLSREGLRSLATRHGLQLVGATSASTHLLTTFEQEIVRWRLAQKTVAAEERVLRFLRIDPGWRFINEDARLRQERTVITEADLEEQYSTRRPRKLDAS